MASVAELLLQQGRTQGDAIRQRGDIRAQTYANLGFEVTLSDSPEAYAAFIRSETQRWGDLVRLARIEPQ